MRCFALLGLAYDIYRQTLVVCLRFQRSQARLGLTEDIMRNRSLRK